MRRKLTRYDAVAENDRLLQPWKQLFNEIKGKWSTHFFKNSHPVTLELACGRGEYTTGLAAHFPDRNFIWLDNKGERIWYGLEKMKEQWLKNAWFIRTIIHHIDHFFESGEIEEIWIIHPDPRPKGSDERRRLTHGRFLAMYQNLLQPWWLLRLKTDDTDLYNRSRESFQLSGWELLEETFDLYQSELWKDHIGITTHYEEMFVAEWRTIKYWVWRAPTVKEKW
jgi:tRNA (guanine-N7-)-methyltransferase